MKILESLTLMNELLPLLLREARCYWMVLDASKWWERFWNLWRRFWKGHVYLSNLSILIWLLFSLCVPTILIHHWVKEKLISILSKFLHSKHRVLSCTKPLGAFTHSWTFLPRLWHFPNDLTALPSSCWPQESSSQAQQHRAPSSCSQARLEPASMHLGCAFSMWKNRWSHHCDMLRLCCLTLNAMFWCFQACVLTVKASLHEICCICTL